MPTCNFCVRPAEHTCCWWLADRIVSLVPSAVKPGMLAASRLAAGQTIRPEIIGVEVCPGDPGGRGIPQREHWVVRIRWKDAEYSWIRSADSPVYIYEPAACGASMCFAHAREVDADHHYCADHWNAWEGSTPAALPDTDFSLQRAIDAELVGRGKRRKALNAGAAIG